MTFLRSATQRPLGYAPPYQETVRSIVSLNQGLRGFWSSSHGWAPSSAADLMTKSRLDWQVELSIALRNWVAPFPADAASGTLIIAWAHLGALVEGTLKLLLVVFYEDYLRDPKAPQQKGVVVSPDGLWLEPLRVYMVKRELLSAEATALVELVQQRRNAIHAFRDRPLGTEAEWRESVGVYLKMLREVNGRLPYPDDNFAPRE